MLLEDNIKRLEKTGFIVTMQFALLDHSAIKVKDCASLNATYTTTKT